MKRYSILVKGIVQGVGFRPFVFKTAKLLLLYGHVLNTSEGVLIEIQGEKNNCHEFLFKLKNNPPPLAYIESIEVTELQLKNDSDFKIIGSSEGTRNTLISPDIGICNDCISDITMKSNRRYCYAFTNCTNCGPRFTIVYDIPYDRKNTTMKEFKMCPQCEEEYENPYDRRFHAQPHACHECGPKLEFYIDGKISSKDPYELFHEFINNGKIVALKGIGGYHLVCDAKNEMAVRRLRDRKYRFDKPFAVMMKDLEIVEKYCELSIEEKSLLQTPAKPIVLLKKKNENFIAPSITMSYQRLGVMLPYTPLHLILMEQHEVLVMTSYNISDLPMLFKDEDIHIIKTQISDAILTHNRKIYRRMDDSVCLFISNKVRMIRRARGYVPEPLKVKKNNINILAMGAQQKNTFCLLKKDNAFISGHMGDLDEFEAEKCYKEEINSFMHIFDFKPEAIACDMHPDYISTNHALSFLNIPIYRVQHHHAHFASVLAEHNILESNVLGIIFDGTGYGEDGFIWGGESLLGSIKENRRIGHLLNFPLLGGEAAIKETWRTAVAAIEMAVDKKIAATFFHEHCKDSEILLRAKEKDINSPLTSSMGRLFDAVSALAGIRKTATYDGQAAVELQQIIDENSKGSYHFNIINEENRENVENMMIFDWRNIICEILEDIKSGTSQGIISFKFHQAVIELITNIAVLTRKKANINTVALSGGVFQNDFILEHSIQALENNGFAVYSNEKVPANDGGISFGQSAVVSYRLR